MEVRRPRTPHHDRETNSRPRGAECEARRRAQEGVDEVAQNLSRLLNDRQLTGEGASSRSLHGARQSHTAQYEFGETIVAVPDLLVDSRSRAARRRCAHLDREQTRCVSLDPSLFRNAGCLAGGRRICPQPKHLRRSFGSMTPGHAGNSACFSPVTRETSSQLTTSTANIHRLNILSSHTRSRELRRFRAVLGPHLLTSREISWAVRASTNERRPPAATRLVAARRRSRAAVAVAGSLGSTPGFRLRRDAWGWPGRCWRPTRRRPPPGQSCRCGRGG